MSSKKETYDFRTRHAIRQAKANGVYARCRPVMAFVSLVKTTLVMQQHLIDAGESIVPPEHGLILIQPLELLFEQLGNTVVEIQLQLDEAMHCLNNNEPLRAAALLKNLLCE